MSMNSDAVSSPSNMPSTGHHPAPALDEMARQGLLGIGVPAAHGGSGGNMRDLFHEVARLAARSPAAALVLAVQRHFIELLSHAQNVGLASYRLPLLIEGHISGACTATWPQSPLPPLLARDTGRGWRLTGAMQAVPNIGVDWYLLTAWVRTLPSKAPFFLMLSSEQDGLRRTSLSNGRADVRFASVLASEVYFREDEVAHENADEIARLMRPVAALLRCAIATGRARARLAVEHHPGSPGELAVNQIVDRLLRGVGCSSEMPPEAEIAQAMQSLTRTT